MKSEAFSLILIISLSLQTYANNKIIKESSVFLQVGSSSRIKPKNETRDWYVVKLNVCNIKTCDPKNGLCTDKNTCECKKGYVNVPELTEKKNCYYEQKKQLTTFLLEMFIMGAGHIYRGSIILGVLKLMFIVLFPCMLLLLVFLGIIVESDIKSQTCFLISSIIFSIFYVVTVFIWYLYDLINIGKNFYPDGNGVPLQAW